MSPRANGKDKHAPGGSPRAGAKDKNVPGAGPQANANSKHLPGVRKAVLAATPYVPDWSDVDRSTCIRLDRNESSRPVPDAVRSVLRGYITANGVQTYPDSDRLMQPLGEYCGVDAEFIMPTNGSDRAIDLSLRTFLCEGRRLLVARPEFPVFSHIAQLADATVDGVPFTEDLEFPYDDFRKAAARKPDVIVIINPNNPTGTPVERSFIEEIIETHRDIPVIVDEAYYEFTGSTVADLTPVHRNLIVLRTFSKAFAMAGLRLGYTIAHPSMTGLLRRLRNPFDVNELAVVAADAYLQNLDAMRAAVAETMTVVKPMVTDYLSEAGVTFWPGAANFMLVKPDDCDDAVAHLRDNHILVRPMSNPLIAGTFRMSLGSADEMRQVIAVLDAYLNRAATH